MKTSPKRTFRKTVAMTVLFCFATQATAANLLSLSTVPLTVSNIPPQIMLTITKDQQLFKKAYNDYSDLDGDGAIDRTYDHTIEYYGYFDPFKCYDYANGRFEPKVSSFSTTTVKVNGVDVTKYLPGLCTSRWNGNFLNWVSMSRMDAVRKLLYGGLRSTDDTFDAALRPVPITVLERAYLPTDAHAWAKHYLPDPVSSSKQPSIDRLTPFTPATSAVTKSEKTTSNVAIPSTTTDISMVFNAALTHIQPGDQVRLQKKGSGANAPQFFATVRDISNNGKTVALRVHASGIFGTGTFDDWDIANLSSTGISFCNLTPGSATSGNANEKSQTNTNPPLIRVAAGNFALWNANERAQCLWAEESKNTQSGFAAGVRSNGNQSMLSGIDASAENPVQNTHGLGTGSAKGEFIARVKVCDPTVFDPAINAEKCKTYPNGNLKPIGLLQEYGDNGRFHFGLITGSYAKNISGGVLRKNVGAFTDEVRTDSDGAFREANTDGTFRLHPYRPRPWTAAAPGAMRATNAEESPPGIVNTLNYMRIYGYRYHRDNGANMDGDYLGGGGDNCTYQLIALKENDCTSWGNPMSEIFFEAVRYFAGAKANYAFTNSGTKDNLLGLPLATFKDPLSKSNYCAPMNVLVFNAAVADNDDDLRTTAATDINSTSTIGSLTNAVGTAEGINGKSFFVGKLTGTPNTDSGYELCTAKTVAALGDVSGICPEGATGGGSYLMSGIAHHAKTNHIRKDLEPLVRGGDVKSLKVTTYGIQLASNTPQLEIDAGNGQKVVIQPIYRLDLTGVIGAGSFGGGGLVDMRYVGKLETTGNTRSGKVYVNWEDSEQGGDYDQDMWGTIEWEVNVSAKTIKVTTNAVSASTANPQGFGYAISGTLNDGPHFHSGIYGFNFPLSTPGTDQTGVLGCKNCRLVGEGVAGQQAGPTSVTYQLGTSSAGKLQDPLWYSAKFGGFTDANSDNIPNGTNGTEWDKENNATGAQTPDGIPDNYFLVTNPLGLVSALKRALDAVAKSGSGAAVMANSTSLSTTNRIYQARYEPSDWHGELIAKEVDPTTGAIVKDLWDAGLLLNKKAPDDRVIWTFNDTATARTGVAFRKASISANLTTLLNVSPISGNADGNGDNRLLYLRGDRTKEGSQGGIFRTRGSVLGDIVDSDPAYVGAPNATQTERSYATFREKYFSRPPMLYVGANDGMLHGFDAVSGEEKLAYVPSKTFPNLTKLTSSLYSHRYYVNGAPQTADVQLGATKAWRTVLVGGLGAGGQGLYALDVTDPAGDFSEANAANFVLWEFNDTDDPDLGYVFGKPVIRKMANGKWAAIVSAGYNNKEGDTAIGTGKAYLFIIFLDGPTGANRTWTADTDYIKIEASISDLLPDVTLPNGLAPPFAADTDGDGSVNFVYSGDLQGNFWKFDVSSKTPVTWKSSKVILFKAVDDKGNKQPITSQAEGTLHPSKPGFILVVGTGKYVETADTVPVFATQSFYGIWDKNDNANITLQTVVTDRDKELFDQPITTVAPGNIRVVPDASPDWTKHLGWRMDFPDSANTGERVVFRPILISSRLIFTTLKPSDDPCAGGGTSFLMIVDPTTGGRVNAAVIDRDVNGKLNDNDKVTSGGQLVFASGIQSTVGISPTPVVVKGGPAGGTSNATTDKIYGTKAPYLAGTESLLGFTFMGGPLGVEGLWIGLKSTSGRVSWREIVAN